MSDTNPISAASNTSNGTNSSGGGNISLSSLHQSLSNNGIGTSSTSNELTTNNQQQQSSSSSSSSSSEVPLENGQQIHHQADLKNEMCRLATFKNWPNPNISPQSLAKAGFYYFNKADQVKCAWCHGIIARWEKNDNAFDEHKRFFPDCPRVKLGPLIEIASDGIRDLGIQQITPPRKPKYSSLDARLRTYNNWPISDIQKPEILAQAGFYYKDIDDQVHCFHCNGGLRSWQKEDDPWFEHAKWFPLCQFLKLVKGQVYINHVQEIGRTTTTTNTTDLSSTSSTSTSAMRLEQQQQQHQQQSSTHVMSLDEAMVTEPVRQALEMGLNVGRVRSATKHHLDYCGKPFETTEELVEAVLEGQVNEEDDGSNDLSSSIVREVSRILNNIFNPRNRSDSDNFDENTSSLTEDDDDSTSTNANVGFYNQQHQHQQHHHHHHSNSNAVQSVTSPQTVRNTTNLNNDSDDHNSVPEINYNPTSQAVSSVANFTGEAIVNANNAAATNNSISINSNSSSSTSSYSKTPQISSDSSILTGTTISPATTTTTTTTTDIDLKKQLSLEEENRKLKDARLCKVCMDEEVGVVFLPCGHLVTCVQCAPVVDQCPLCRQAIKGLVRTFLP